MDETIVSFKEITGETNSEEARHLLDACEGDLERAINLYFASRNPHNSGNPTNGGSISFDQNEDDIQMLDRTNDVEALAGAGENDVREPIQPLHGPIVHQSFRQTYRNALHRQTNPIFEQYHHDFAQEIVHDIQFPGAIQHVISNVEVELNGDQQSNGNPQETNEDIPSSSAEPKARKLASLFRPPVELMYRGNWDGALEEARNQQRWLLVNIQKATEFACQVLNRDVFNVSAVQELIKSNFVFWQIYHDSSDGMRIRGYYNANSFPAIFLVDPRTGEEVLKIPSATPDAVTFLDQIATFLATYPDFYSRDRIFSANQLEHQPQASPTDPGMGPQKRKAGVKQEQTNGHANDDLVAEQQAKRMKRVVTITDGDVSGSERSPSTSSAAFLSDRGVKKVGQAKEKLIIDPTEWMVHLTASPPANFAKRIQIVLRLPNTSTTHRETIELWPNTKLRALFSFIATQDLDPEKYSLVMGYPKRVLTLADADKTLEEAGFTAREMIHIELN